MSGSGSPKALPPPIVIRLNDLRRHFEALRHAMGTFGEDFEADAFRAASLSHDPAELASVYAVERPFELLDNYIVELAAEGLSAAGVAIGDLSGVRLLRAL